MWTPAMPIVIAGYALTRDEAWLREFTKEWFSLIHGDADTETVAAWAIELLTIKGARDPVEVAREEWSRVD
jgi:hypothetical protein